MAHVFCVASREKWCEHIGENSADLHVSSFFSLGNSCPDVHTVTCETATVRIRFSYYSTNSCGCPTECLSLREYFIPLSSFFSLSLMISQ